MKDVRELMGKVVALLFAGSMVAVAVYATWRGSWSVPVGLVTAAMATGSLIAASVPWRRLPIHSFLGLYWLSVGIVISSVYAFGQPALIVFLLQPIMFLTYFFWRDRLLVVTHMAAVTVVYSLPFITGVGSQDASKLLVTLPTFLIVAALVGVLADRFQAMRKVERERFKATIEALSTALTARDGYTGSHSHETLWFVRAVCEELGLSPLEKEYIADVALLHDIGKIGVPNEVLHAPGKLDEVQWLVMKEHPVIGERIVATVPGLEEVARAIRHEHEHWDGSGYPDGLVENEIPLASRIVLVCDAYHAMTSDRPYRVAMSAGEARHELSRCAGSQFDPTVVGAMLRALDRRDGVPEGDAVVSRVFRERFATSGA